VVIQPTEPVVAHLNGNTTFHCLFQPVGITTDTLLDVTWVLNGLALETPWPDGVIEFQTVPNSVVRIGLLTCVWNTILPPFNAEATLVHQRVEHQAWLNCFYKVYESCNCTFCGLLFLLLSENHGVHSGLRLTSNLDYPPCYYKSGCIDRVTQ
jgi:hypothetical protein